MSTGSLKQGYSQEGFSGEVFFFEKDLIEATIINVRLEIWKAFPEIQYFLEQFFSIAVSHCANWATNFRKKEGFCSRSLGACELCVVEQ